jgi:hypothetical protein
VFFAQSSSFLPIISDSAKFLYSESHIPVGWCLDSSSLDKKIQVKVTLRLTVGQSVSLGVEPNLGPMTRYLLLFDSYCLVFCGAPSLMRGQVRHLHILLALASAVSRPHFTVSDLRLPFSPPPTTRRVTVEVFDPASTRVNRLDLTELFLITTLHGPRKKYRLYFVAKACLQRRCIITGVNGLLLAGGICLPSRCLAMNVYFNFVISAFGRHVTV